MPKAIKNKTKGEMISDLLNYQISKDNIYKSKVKTEHKDKIKK